MKNTDMNNTLTKFRSPFKEMAYAMTYGEFGKMLIVPTNECVMENLQEQIDNPRLYTRELIKWEVSKRDDYGKVIFKAKSDRTNVSGTNLKHKLESFIDCSNLIASHLVTASSNAIANTCFFNFYFCSSKIADEILEMAGCHKDDNPGAIDKRKTFLTQLIIYRLPLISMMTQLVESMYNTGMMTAIEEYARAHNMPESEIADRLDKFRLPNFKHYLQELGMPRDEVNKVMCDRKAASKKAYETLKSYNVSFVDYVSKTVM